ncbi:hypothetical protein PWT90_07534 [Aphanocladium album]|nr:hypothetical protein PWT90_07534 [Aphanocladium album]
MTAKNNHKYARLGTEDSDDFDRGSRSFLGRELCDAVRSQLQEHQSMGPRADEVLQLLSAMKNDESDGRYSVNIDTISACRLDKLLFDITLPENACSEVEVALAHNLQRKWRLRFRQEYFDIDKTRFAMLATTYGQLRDIIFTDTHLFAHGRWQAARCDSLSEVEGNQQFEPGQYIIRQYGHKLQPETGLHRVIITLERVPGQKAMEELTQIPRPSQMDDWMIFERYEGEMVKKRRGNEAFTEWKVEKAQEKVDHSEWERVTRMTADLQQRKKAIVQFAEEHIEIP